MALSLRFDHRLDRLADAFAERIAGAPGGPLATHTVIAPSLGVGRWLQQHVARRDGICARVEIDFAGRCLWRIVRAVWPELSERSPFDADTARWVVLELLERVPDRPELAPLANRVSRAVPSERLALAGEVAQRFERYLAYRRDWLERWQAGRWGQGDAALGPHEAWQRWLWRELLERLPRVSRAHPYERLEAALRDDPRRVERALAGRRVALFGTVGVAPEQLALFGRLSAVLDVDVFAPDPCRELWSDLIDPASLARIRAERPDVAWLYESEPSVLGSWGRSQRDFVAQVLSLEDAAQVQHEAPFREEVTRFEALEEMLEIVPDAASNATSNAASLHCLEALQSAVFMRSDRPWSSVSPDGADDSLQIHAVHSRARAAQVLHERLLDCFEALPGLLPGDVAVFCASVDEDAAAIESQFAAVAPSRRVPIAVSGRAARSDPLARAALELLSMARNRMPLPEFSQWLLNPAVMRALRLDEEASNEIVRRFDAAGARWGLDAGDGAPKHHWRAALDRLLIGAAFAHDVALVGDVAPAAGGSIGEAGELERVLPVLDAVRSLAALGAGVRAVSAWCAALRGVLERLFGHERTLADALAQVFDALATIEDGVPDGAGARVDAAGFEQVLAEALDRGASAALASGAVTVCPLGGLRGVPFRVVCLFGMDEGAYPRRPALAEFDLMRRAPRFGDRLARHDDRGVFLDALLAARERVIVLYQGRDARDDATRNPSTLVSECLAYVNERIAQHLPAHARAFVPVVHPLHPFSPRAFAGPAPAFADEWLETARTLASPLVSRRDAPAPLSVAAPAQAAPDAIDLATAGAALAQPARAYLETVLGVRLPWVHAATESIEPLWHDPRADRRAIERAALRLLEGVDPDVAFAELAASASIAAGGAGRQHARFVLSAARDLAQRSAAPDDAAPVRRRVSAYPCGARTIVEAWVAHLAWLVGPPSPGEASPPAASAISRTACADAVIEVRIADPEPALAHLFEWGARIRREPLPLLPATWYAYAQKERREDALDAMRGDGGRRRRGELEQDWYRALYRGVEPDLDRVLQASARVYARVLADCDVVKAKKR